VTSICWACLELCLYAYIACMFFLNRILNVIRFLQYILVKIRCIKLVDSTTAKCVVYLFSWFQIYFCSVQYEQEH
jgi:hypothetical protein